MLQAQHPMAKGADPEEREVGGEVIVRALVGFVALVALMVAWNLLYDQCNVVTSVSTETIRRRLRQFPLLGGWVRCRPDSSSPAWRGPDMAASPLQGSLDPIEADS
jgi:hypothetical protein